MRALVQGGGERTAAAIAARQRGVLSRAQLLWAGIGEDGIAYRLQAGRLHRCHRGVYLLGHRAAAPLAREFAAVLAGGRDAVLSHESAATVWGIWRHAPREVHVTVPGRHAARGPGIRPHRSTTLVPRDVTTKHGIPITSPARTLLDLAEALPLGAVERALEEARLGKLVNGRDIDEILTRSVGRRGAGRLRRAAVDDSAPKLTKSEAEARLLRLLRRAGIPPDETNYELIPPHEVDMYWRAERLIVEVDGWEFHKSRAAFERDRARDARHIAAGYRVMRITWRQIEHEPEAVVVRIAQALALAR